jgi:hypothetical protein
LPAIEYRVVFRVPVISLSNIQRLLQRGFDLLIQPSFYAHVNKARRYEKEQKGRNYGYTYESKYELASQFSSKRITLPIQHQLGNISKHQVDEKYYEEKNYVYESKYQDIVAGREIRAKTG